MKKQSTLLTTLFAALLLASSADAKVLTTIDEYFADSYESASHIDQETLQITNEVAQKAQETLGFPLNPEFDTEIPSFLVYEGEAVVAYGLETTVQGKWGGIHFLVMIHPEGVVDEVVVLDYSEVRGKPVGKKRFLRQFKKKSMAKKIRLGRDVKGITGASISSTGMVNGVNKLLYFFKVFYAAQVEAT